jgi:hypothetical protein
MRVYESGFGLPCGFKSGCVLLLCGISGVTLRKLSAICSLQRIKTLLYLLLVQYVFIHYMLNDL